jgi:hypothetical protein
VVCGHGRKDLAQVEAVLRFTTFDGKSVALLDFAPDWVQPFQCDTFLDSHVEDGLTGREGRRALAVKLRFSVSFRVTVSGVDARRLYGGLKTYQAQPLGVPLWPAAVAWSERATRFLKGGVNLVFKPDWSQWELYFDGSEPGWPAASDIVVPVLFGRIEDRDLRWPSPEIAQLSVNFDESSPASWAVETTGAALTSGPLPSVNWTTAPHIWTTPVNFDEGRQTTSVRVERSQIGFGREQSETLYPQSTRFEQESDHIAHGATEIASLFEFFKQNGAGKAFWILTWTMATRLTADVGELVTLMAVEDTTAIEVGDWLAFTAGTGAPIIRKVVSKNAGAVGVDSPIGFAYARVTLVSHAKLMRFRKASMRVSFVNSDLAATSLSLLELPDEYTPAADEELGLTLGQLWHRVFLYEITKRVGQTNVVERLTSHEEDIELDGYTYTAAKIDHGAMRQGVALDRDSVDVRFFLGASPTLQDAARLRSNGPIKIVIKEASITQLPEFTDEYTEDFQ